MTVYERKRLEKAMVLLAMINEFDSNFMNSIGGNIWLTRSIIEEFNCAHKTDLSISCGAFRAVIINKRERYVIKIDRQKNALMDDCGCVRENANYSMVKKDYPDLLKYLVKPILCTYQNRGVIIMPYIVDAGLKSEESIEKFRNSPGYQALTSIFDDLHDKNWGFAPWNREQVKIFDYAI